MNEAQIKLLNLLVSNIKLNKLYMDMFDEMNKEFKLNEKQQQFLEASKEIYISQVQQLQSIIDSTSARDN
jgi:hypothetical protein